MRKGLKPYDLIQSWRKPMADDEESVARIMAGLKKSAWA
jgi:hypothetical protein